MSADVKSIRMLLDNGSIADFKVEDITAVEFSAAQGAARADAGSVERPGADHRPQGNRAQRPAHAGDRGRRRAGRP